MKTVTSRDNPAYRHIAALLKEARARKESGQTILEGIHLCQTYLQQQGRPEQLWCADKALANPHVSRIVSEAGCDTFCIPEKLFAAISGVEHGTGPLCLIKIPQAELPAQVTDTCLLLDRVQDPGNLGTLMRSAAAAGHKAIFCGPGCVDPWSPKVLRAGMGAHFFLDVFNQFDWENLLARMALPLLATDLNAAQELYALDLRGAAAWLFGNEGSGLDPALLKAATTRVRIPQPGSIESLNVAAAAAICLFEQVRQQRNS